MNQNISAATLQADDKILIGGSFDAFVGGASGSHNRLVRLSRNGDPDPTFDIGIGFPMITTIGSSYISTSPQSVNSLAVDSKGRVLVCGNLVKYDTQPVSGLLRLLPDGALDLTFQPGITSPIGIFLNDAETFYVYSERVMRRRFSEPTRAEDIPEVTITPLSSSSLRLEWAGNGAAEYTVELWNSSGWAPVSTVTGTTYEVQNATPGLSRSYRIRSAPSGGPVYSLAYQARSYTQFEHWKTERGKTPDANPSELINGVPLLVHYALGMDPGSLDHSKLPSYQVHPDDHTEMSFTKSANELTYIAEYSEDLTNWKTEGITESAGLAPGETKARIPMHGKKNVFFRLRVVEP
jgi:hypothetical protein